MKKLIIKMGIISIASLMSILHSDTLTLQNGIDSYSGCEDRSLFQIKVSSSGSNWGGSMAGTFPEMDVHGEEANDGETPKLAFGQLIC